MNYEQYKAMTETVPLDRFALAGFKLYTMLKVAPEELRSMLPPDTTATVNTTPPIAKQADLPDKTDRIVALALKVSGQPGEYALKALETLIAYESTKPNPTALSSPVQPPEKEAPPVKAKKSRAESQDRYRQRHKLGKYRNT